ncbi:hypothetical protein H0I29_09155 [Polaribacter sp. R2A056_3_33]|nr:hypothetical protein [Polaribacter sp. R2A056_3_33]QXP68819.1 hypothetical protein H0I29_09155 [Polaribacter sp. R2A056_3_33]
MNIKLVKMDNEIKHIGMPVEVFGHCVISNSCVVVPYKAIEKASPVPIK